MFSLKIIPRHNTQVFLIGDYCKPCQCSGNIDPNDAASCDTVTGDCLRCLNNTYGVACALCAPGYFGDAVNLKDCQGNNNFIWKLIYILIVYNFFQLVSAINLEQITVIVIQVNMVF